MRWFFYFLILNSQKVSNSNKNPTVTQQSKQNTSTCIVSKKTHAPALFPKKNTCICMNAKIRFLTVRFVLNKIPKPSLEIHHTIRGKNGMYIFGPNLFREVQICPYPSLIFNIRYHTHICILMSYIYDVDIDIQSYAIRHS